MRALPLLLVALVVAGCAAPAPPAADAAVPRASGHEAAPDATAARLAYLDGLALPVRPDAPRAVREVEALTMKPAPLRHSNLALHDTARAYVEAAFEEAGLEASRFSFSGRNALGRGIEVPGENVLGVLPGRDAQRLLVFGAHLDSAETAIGGAYDNGSGLCALLELARALAPYDWNHTLVFAAWDWEESGLHGSRAYAEHLRAQGVEVTLYLNHDMVGLNWPAKGFGALDEPLTAGFGGDGHEAFAQMHRDAFAWLGYPPDATRVVTGLTGGSSDHGPFLRNGYAAATFLGMPPVEYPFYHSADTYAAMLLAAGGSEEALVAGFDTVLEGGFVLALLVDHEA